MKRDFSAIFKSNDVRAIAGKELTEETAYAIGKACTQFFGKKGIIVGADMRLSSPMLDKALIRGITDAGGKAIELGLIGTDVAYFASGFMNKPSVMITASHNPKEYNGMKFTDKAALIINNENGLNEIQRLAEHSDRIQTFRKKGRIFHTNVYPHYVDHVLSFVNKKRLRAITVVVDAGNGMAGKTYPLVYQTLQVHTIPLYFLLDGRFPHHVPNPMIPKNTRMLQRMVVHHKADYGLEFDADTDRVFFIDEKGRRVPSGVIGALIMSHLFLKRKGCVVYSTPCGQIVEETAKKLGGTAFEERVGHSYIKTRMRKEHADFGLEHTGHFFYRKNYYSDSGVITSLLVAQIYSEQEQSFSEMIRPFWKYANLEEMSLAVKDTAATVKKLEHAYLRRKPVKKSRIDGLKLYFPDFWILIRAGRTEPVIRIDMEAVNKKRLDEERKKVLKIIG